MGTNASILLINKKPGITSFSSLNDIKRTIEAKVGHAGTLDKFAQGLLIVLTGSMTRLNVLFSSMDKTYRAQIAFGSETDTLDPEGQVIAVADVPGYEQIQKSIPSFIGSLEQQPPQYSALHINGKRASDLARRGHEVQMAKRPITVYSFEPVSYEQGILVADIHVSKGTYIRSLARDLGLAAGSRAHLVGLTRTAIGPFHLSEAVDAKQRESLLASMGQTDALLKRVASVSIFEVEDEQELFRLANGSFPRAVKVIRQSDEETYGALYSTDGVLRAVADMKEGRIIAQIHPYRKEIVG
ncbi:MAG: tRNA pseudouridine(55) synthase TruB [Sphaerochaeta sp.]|jgi:tRNA pseudouridine55 synthase|uniref:tRNA pseudouridine(55) synthase TruB n=1 Tax=Sphaerochaeta sp. TaxID=1972642 RepID=UPI000B0CAAEB|nr:tRNA pseudouridine(55) synthase TruB [Sphaerochaeta sp.]MDX9824403.1 tRNA pseudouridine(55) synthase TruB [Sphaerochaeta sp.]